MAQNDFTLNDWLEYISESEERLQTALLRGENFQLPAIPTEEVYHQLSPIFRKMNFILVPNSGKLISFVCH